MNRIWTVYLIQHSHTDIGYTERQEKLARYHSDFICQAIDILNEIHEGKRPEARGFVWQCENYWQVRNFYESVSEEYKKNFEKYVRTGEIGLSGNYLNLNELISIDVLNSRLDLMRLYGEKIGYPIHSAMCADINGMAWGYADVLYEHGVEHMFTCIHPHHGMFPLYQKQTPFYWESPKGNKVLVWNGDYYHLGNELHFVPNAPNTYMILDEFDSKLRNREMYDRTLEENEKTELEICDVRLTRYLDNLEAEGYPADFVPFMVSGCITDNAAPSAAVAERVNFLNEKFKGKIQFQLVNLDQFFCVVKNKYGEIPCYRGDFTDWWADGIGSTPGAVMLYRDAVRKNNLCTKLDAAGGDSQLREETEENLMQYAEHTWGYSSSVTEPWEPLVNSLDLKKTAYAVNAHTAASKNLDQLLAKRGEISIRQYKGQNYRIINPHKTTVQAPAFLYIEFWEFIEGVQYRPDMPIEVIDNATGKVIPSQVKTIARAYQVEIMLTLAPGEVKDVKIVCAEKVPQTILNHAGRGADKVFDLLREPRKDIGCVETEGLRVEFDQKKGICSVYDKKKQCELLRNDGMHAPFTGIYEVTDGGSNQYDVRRLMGRNRKCIRTKRSESRLVDISVVEQGAVYTTVELDYTLEGCNFYQVYLKVYESVNLMEAKVRIHKQSIWNPENLYIALPFTAGEEAVTWIDKTGCVLRPGIDQLPGSCMEFYLIQNGVVLDGDKGCVIMAIKDTPLITMGSLESGPIRLCDGNDWEKNRSQIYAWTMNNFWETNFKAETGGFYEFTYQILSVDKKLPEEAMKLCEAANEGILSFYVEKF